MFSFILLFIYLRHVVFQIVLLEMLIFVCKINIIHILKIYEILTVH